MALRAKKPEAIQKRLKLFMFAQAGVGKTTASVQMPNAYIIDTEKGTENYASLINGSNSVVFQTNDIEEVIKEVRSLLTEQHDFRTLVIDPITPLYDNLLEACEKKVGSEFGRHYGEANKIMKRLFNLIMSLDMNVCVTCHAKTEYGDNLKKLGVTFDGWKKLDYIFDLVLSLEKQAKKRYARVVKTRIESFPDGDRFEWDYNELVKRCGETLTRASEAVKLATPEQTEELTRLLKTVILPDGTLEKWLTKANVDTLEDMPSDVISKCIEYVKSKLSA